MFFTLTKPKWHPSEALHWQPASTVFAACTALALYDADPKRPLNEGQAVDIAATYWLALDVMVRGDASELHWATVAFSLNLGLILCEMGIGEAYTDDFRRALDGIFVVQLRGQKTGAWRFDATGLAAVRKALWVHDEQLELATKEEVTAAKAEIQRRVMEGNTYSAEAA